METITQFKVGKTYYTRSICDADTFYEVKVVKRTDKTVTVEMGGSVKNCRIKVWSGEECIKPFGNYSMAPTIRATKAR